MKEHDNEAVEASRSNELLCAACNERLAAHARDFLKPNGEPVQTREARWYRQYGKYPERITKTATGAEYLIGDASWNSHHPEKPEAVESIMRGAKLYSA